MSDSRKTFINKHFKRVDKTLELSQQLIQKPSVTPNDEGCLELLAQRLAASGFTTEQLPFEDVSNAWIRRGTQAPLFVFAGHTDVVPTGPEDQWAHPPFAATVTDGKLHGRGSADMKTGIAAMVSRLRRVCSRQPKIIKGRLHFY